MENMDQSSYTPSLSKARLVKPRKNLSNMKPQSVPNSEKIDRSNPFVHKEEVRVSESSGVHSNSGVFYFGGTNFNGEKPVLGSGGSNSSCRRVGGFESAKSEGFQFVFGSGLEQNDGSSWESSLGSDEGLLFTKLPDDTRKMDLKSSGTGYDFEKKRQVENGIVFGVGSVNGAGCANASGLEKGSFSKLPEEMSNLNLKNSINVDDFEKNKQASNVFVFGGSKTSSVPGSPPINVNTHFSSFCSDGCENSNEGVFISGKLPDEVRRLNLKNFDNVEEFEKNKQAENVFILGGSKNSSGSSSGSNVNKISVSAEFVSSHGGASCSKPINIRSKKPSVDSFSFSSKASGESDASTFVFGTGGKRSVDEGLFFKLPDETRKMNLTRGDGFEKSKTADNCIRFGGDRDATGSSCGSSNNVPGKTGKLNVGRKTATQSMNNETIGSATGLFVFGSSTEKCSVSGFDNGTTFNHPTGKKFCTQGQEKDKEMGHREKVDGGNSFTFGTTENTSAYLGGSMDNSTLHDDVEKLSIGTNTEKLAGSVPFEFAFQGGKHDDRSNMTSIPSSSAPKFQSTHPTFSFTGKPAGLETPHMEFKTHPSTKETLFPGTYQNMPFSAKKSDARKTTTKKKKGKPRPIDGLYQNFAAQRASEESDPQENLEVETTEGYSPMDYSPYHEELVTDQHSREPSVASEDSIHFFSRGASDTQKSVSGDELEEVLVSEAQRLDLSEGTCQGEVGDNGSEDLVKRDPNAESVFLDDQTDRFENDTNMSKLKNVDQDNDARTSPMDYEAGFSSSYMERPAREDGTEFTFSSSLGDLGESNFKFAASPSVRVPLPAAKHTYRRKNRLKSGQNPSVFTANARVTLTSPLPVLLPHISTSGLPDLGQNSTLSAPQSEDERKTGKSKESNARQEPTTSAADSVPVQQTCEKWRFRGNQAYANGHLIKAEDYYTRGVNSISLKEIPSSCIKPLSLCYSNLAATRMSLGKWREALNDCKMAVSLDPNFLKARVRVANCYLALGEIGEALNHFKKLLQSEKDISSNHKYIIEASNGLLKAQQVADLTSQSAELLLRSNDAPKALNMISEALSVSPHSESLLEMKAEALLVMRNYEDVIKLCEQTLDLAEQNSVVTESDSQFENVHSSELVESPRLWRWRLIAKSYFYLGKLEEALELFQKHEKEKPPVDKSLETSTSFAVMVCELLRLKTAGNEAFLAGRHLEAVEYYSSALACNAESRPFAAVCFCNRAAAYQALGQITDAIADCSLAIALDPSYAKAISRRATLHELIRDYGQAANNLSRLISLFQKQMQEKDKEKYNESRGVGRSSSNVPDLKRARARLASVEEEARKGLSLNMYMILGIEPSTSSADVKKAYRKAALRHHPDKAAQFLVRNENVDDGLWREVAAEVHADADRLFKMIGQAYATLSDPTKRLKYDEEEEMRSCPVRGSDASSPKTSSYYTYSSHQEKGFDRHPWRSRANI